MAPRYLFKMGGAGASGAVLEKGGSLSEQAAKILRMQLAGSEDAAEAGPKKRGGAGKGGGDDGGGDSVADAWAAACAAVTEEVKNSGKVMTAADGDEGGVGRNRKKRDSLYAGQGGRMDMEGNRPRKTYKKGRRPGDPNGPSYVRDKW